MTVSICFMQKTWVEISKENLISNINQFRQRVGEQVKIAGIVKSNAYGHGLGQVSDIIQDQIDWFGVDSVDEALQVSRNLKVESRKPILILGYTIFDRLEDVVDNEFHQVVANIETAKKLKEIAERLNKIAKIHLKIETGTSRQGIFPKDLKQFIELIKSSDNLQLAGVSTHYANIEDTTDSTYAMNQLANYKEAVEYIGNHGLKEFIKHTACSAATVLFPDTYFDMVRVGISMYGMWSSSETEVSAKQKGIELNLKPSLTWKTRIAHIKTLPAGTAVSYGCTEKVTEDTKVAVLPIGYWDGFDRGLSSLGTVLVNGKICRVIGRVCMNMCVIDVNHLPNIKLEDEVVILGEQAGEKVTAEDIASKIQTINYEVTTRINPLIERKIV